MRSSHIALHLFGPFLLLTAVLSAQDSRITITGQTVTFPSFSRNLVAVQNDPLTLPPRQMSYKGYRFVINSSTINLNNFREPDALQPQPIPDSVHEKPDALGVKLRGQKGIGRLVLFTTCLSACNQPDPSLHQEVWVNVSDEGDNWKRAAVVDAFGLTLETAMFNNPKLEFAINGSLVRGNGSEMRIGNQGISHYYIQVFENNHGCRRYEAVYGNNQSYRQDDADFVSIELTWKRQFPKVANGIVIGAPKVYDTYALAALRSQTLKKLRDINPFVASAITGAYGNVQGITRDQSYTNVQAQLGLPRAGSASSTDQTATCPTGYYPAGPLACAPIPTGTTASAPASTTNNSQTTSPSTVTPTFPTAPTYNPLVAPTNVGQSSSDTLVEQVQLSAQLQMYDLLLQGAQSDSLYIQNSRAIANRAQTTVSFPISIDPPRQFHHAVAEVRVLIEPFPTAESGQTEPVSIVNLLPSQKTYNVARITSKQHSFGGAAVIEQVANVGVSSGKSKDRLYLAKDTDTVALQYDHPSVTALHPALPDRALTGLQAAIRMQRLEDCENEWYAIENSEQRLGLDIKDSRNNSVMFGWQFRPVLGADYVASGPRQVFAQLALPEALEDTKFLPAVLVQTRWREYDEKRQVVGPVFHSSCTTTAIKDPVIIENPLRVHDTTWEDLGNGTIKIRAHGNFFSPGIFLQSGNSTYPPVTFDGHEIQFFAPAKDVINNGELSLVGENSRAASLTIPRASHEAGCGIKKQSLYAVPQNDGTARVQLILWPEENFADDLSHSHPLVLIGSDVYGLKDKPFQYACDHTADHVCVYNFTAPADALRSSTNYYVRNLSWSNSNIPGSVHFAPLMDRMSKYYDDSSSPADASTRLRKGKHLMKPTFMIFGSDLKLLNQEKKLNLKVYSMDSPEGVPVTSNDLNILSDSQALLTLPQTPQGKGITVAWIPSSWPLSAEAPITWQLALPVKGEDPQVTSNPTFIYAGDSRTVTYSGIDLSTVVKIAFESYTAIAFKFSDDDPKSLDVSIPTYVTKEAGHKEMIATTKTAQGKTGKIILPIDIFKR